jgi:hypothetical protein
LVINSDDAWAPPGGSFRFLPLGPGTHGTSKDHLTAARLDRDPVGVDQRIASKRFLDLVLYLCGGYLGL